MAIVLANVGQRSRTSDRAESNRVEPSRAESNRVEPSRAESSRVESSRADIKAGRRKSNGIK